MAQHGHAVLPGLHLESVSDADAISAGVVDDEDFFDLQLWAK